LLSIGVNAGNVEISDNKHIAAGSDGFHIDAPLDYSRIGEEKISNEKLSPDGMEFLTISQLCGSLDIAAGEAFPIDMRQEICIAAQNAGSLIIPDIVREPVSGADDIITLVPIYNNDSLTPLYAKKHLLIELGMAIAGSDGKIENYEIIQLSYVMEKHFSFTDLEIRAFTALKDFSLAHLPDIQTAAMRLAGQLSMEERLEACKMMTTVAAAGGQLARMEFDTLGLLFDIMGLGDDALNHVIDELHLKRIWILLKHR
jgi:uncharacterized tellurite resistance protein B-like protein